MDIKFTDAAPALKGVVAVPVLASKTLSPDVRKTLGQALISVIDKAMAASPQFKGDKEQVQWLHGLTGTGGAALSVLLYGLGEAKTLTSLDTLKIGGGLAASFKSYGATTASVILPKSADSQSYALGLSLRAYRFQDYKTGDKTKNPPALKTVTFHTDTAKQAQKDWTNTASVSHGVSMARDLMNQPPNICTPDGFAKTVKKALTGLPVKVTVWDQKTITSKKMGGVLAVARGNRNGPRVMIVEYNGLKTQSSTTKKPAKTQPIALVGKGITFDTGGYCVKPGATMPDMKYDMGGAAAVMGTVLALAQSKAKIHVVGIVGLTENLIDDDAYLPSEVITTMSGKTVEIIDTDAEGRIVLADLLTSVQRDYKPSEIIDIATLTGAAIVALGHEYSALLSNNDAMADKVLASGRTTGEKCWRLPIDAAPMATLKSSIADFINVHPSRMAGASFAGLFLQQFIENDTPWVHLDIAGHMRAQTDTAICPAGAIGYGVRLMHHYIMSKV